MKAERRHELQTNSLARFLENLPLYLRFHFAKIVLGALVLVLLTLLIRYRMTAGQTGRQQATAAQRDVRRMLGELQVVDLTRPTLDMRAADRKRFAADIEGSIDAILQQTEDGPDDAAMRAEAIVARGDLNWVMANLPPLPGAATQPALQMPKTSEQYLDDAEAAYQQVLKQYPDRQMAALTAQFGLASIAENRQQWDAARTQYQSLLAKEDAPQLFREWAALRLQMLPMLQEPVFTGTLTSQPTTLPETSAAPASATQPATGPATLPSS
jgi:hypothetical protein